MGAPSSSSRIVYIPPCRPAEDLLQQPLPVDPEQKELEQMGVEELCTICRLVCPAGVQMGREEG